MTKVKQVHPDKVEDVNHDDSELKIEQQTKTLSQSFKYLFCRLYLLAFCIYVPAFNLIYYNLFGVVPFYLHKVLGADTMFVSYLSVSLSILIAIATILLSCLLRKLDQIIPWLQSRMIMTLLPMALQMVFNISLTTCSTVYGGVFILTLSAIAASTLFSGSVLTLNYEMDPKNSAVLVSVFNSCGQASGFLGPLLMAAITHTDHDTPHYDSVYRRRWSYFFYAMAGSAAVGFMAIVLAYILKPSEWINREEQIRKAQARKANQGA